ncbi:unnamed protein product [Lathyrus oleraceus]
MVLCMSIYIRSFIFSNVRCFVCFCISISDVENETTWRRWRLDLAYLEYDEMHKNGSDVDRKPVIAKVGACSTSVDSVTGEEVKDSKGKRVPPTEDVGDVELVTPKVNMDATKEPEGPSEEFHGKKRKRSCVGGPSHISISLDSESGSFLLHFWSTMFGA